MKINLRKIHFVFGAILLVIFPVTGWYLRHRVPDLMQGSDRFRFSMRGNHIYILLSSLIHLLLGIYLQQSSVRWVRKLQMIGSVLLVISSGLVVAAFFYESKSDIDRPFTLMAMVLALVGTLAQVFNSLKRGAAQTE